MAATTALHKTDLNQYVDTSTKSTHNMSLQDSHVPAGSNAMACCRVNTEGVVCSFVVMLLLLAVCSLVVKLLLPVVFLFVVKLLLRCICRCPLACLPPAQARLMTGGSASCSSRSNEPESTLAKLRLVLISWTEMLDGRSGKQCHLPCVRLRKQ